MRRAGVRRWLAMVGLLALIVRILAFVGLRALSARCLESSPSSLSPPAYQVERKTTLFKLRSILKISFFPSFI